MPPEISDGELAAIAAADEDGWIIPPVYNSLRPEPPRAWRTAHLRYLARRGLIGGHRYRVDTVLCVRLNAQGMSMRQSGAGLPLLDPLFRQAA